MPPRDDTRGTTRRRRRVRPQRAAEIVASDVRGRILTGELDEGLPTEGILLEEFAVSRPTLREALRILEAEGLIQTRRGKQGGAIVRRPTVGTVAYHLGLALQGSGVELADLADARRLLEPLCVSLVAQRSDRDQVAERLDALNTESEALVGNGPDFTASLLRFHAALVDASENETLKILVGTIEAVWQGQERAWAIDASAHGAYPDEESQRNALKAHRRIARRILTGDAEGAMRASRTHLVASMSYVRDGGEAGAEPDGATSVALGHVVDATPLRP